MYRDGHSCWSQDQQGQGNRIIHGVHFSPCWSCDQQVLLLNQRLMENGKIYFFTASILKWNPILFDSGLKQIILESLKFLFLEKAIKIYGFVIIPNHIHLILMPLNNPKFKNVQLSFMRFTAQKSSFTFRKKHLKSLTTFW